mmetsp:Transcript_42760/g.137834  ORF Transcript_42760/g.137834 Transcript_42760/m.137834 type:complete len:375 (+) Transcript_42760:483-1607(+)
MSCGTRGQGDERQGHGLDRSPPRLVQLPAPAPRVPPMPRPPIDTGMTPAGADARDDDADAAGICRQHSPRTRTQCSGSVKLVHVAHAAARRRCSMMKLLLAASTARLISVVNAQVGGENHGACGKLQPRRLTLMGSEFAAACFVIIAACLLRKRSRDDDALPGRPVGQFGRLHCGAARAASRRALCFAPRPHLNPGLACVLACNLTQLLVALLRRQVLVLPKRRRGVLAPLLELFEVDASVLRVVAPAQDLLDAQVVVHDSPRKTAASRHSLTYTCTPSISTPPSCWSEADATALRGRNRPQSVLTSPDVAAAAAELSATVPLGLAPLAERVTRGCWQMTQAPPLRLSLLIHCSIHPTCTECAQARVTICSLSW